MRAAAAAAVARARGGPPADPPRDHETPADVRHAHLVALLDINRKIGALAPTDALLSSIAEEAARLLDVDNAGFRLLEGDELVLAGVAGHADQTMVRQRLKIGESLSGKVVASGRTLRCDIDSVPDMVPEHVAADHRLGYTTYLGVPLRVGERTIGVLAFRARRPFTDLDQELAEAFAGQAAIALEHSRLFQDATRQASRMEALADIGRLLAETLDPELLARQIVGSTRALFGAQTSMLLRLDETTGDLVATAISGDAGPLPDDRLVCPAGTDLAGLALRERALVTTADVLADPRVMLTGPMRARIQQAGYRAGLAVPLVVRGRVSGVLAVGTHAGRVFSADDLSLAQAFAAEAAVALDNASLYVEATRRGREAEAIADVARSLNTALDTDTVLQRVTEYARDLCHADLAVIGLREVGGEAMILRHASGTRARRLHETLVEPGKGVGGIVIASGRPFRTDDYLVDSRISQDYADNVRAEGIVAEMVVPLLSAGRVEGLLYVDRRTAQPFTDHDEAVLSRLADHAAVAVTNARLYAAAGDRAARLRTLNRLNRLVSSSLDIGEVLTDIASAAREFMNSGSVVFWLADETTRTLRASAFSHAAAREHFGELSLPFGDGAPGWVATHRVALTVPDVFAPDSVVTHHDWWRANELSSLLAVPVMQGERLLAVLSLAGREPFRLGPDDHELLESFVSQAAAAIRNAELYAETDRRRREAVVLADVAGSINASLDLATVLERVSVGARELCGSDIARILLREPGGNAVVGRAGSGVRAAGTHSLRVEAGKGLGGTVLATGRPLRTADYARDPRFEKTYLDVVNAEGVVSTMAVPIVIDGQVEGLVFVDHRTTRVYTDADEAILTRLAEHAAVAIRNARLYRETAEYAERLRALDEVNRLVSSSLNPDEVLQNIAAAAARFFDAPWVSMWVVDAARQRVVRSFVIGDAAIAGALPTELALGEGTVGWVAAHRSPVLWSATVEAMHVAPQDADLLREHGLPYRLVYPITIGERVLGVLAVNRATPVPMTPETETLLRSLAAQAALALDHARLFSETARRLEQTRALLDVAELLNSTLDGTQLLERVTMRIAQVCRVDRCAIERWDGNRVTPVMSQFADADARPTGFAERPAYTPGDVPAHARAMETRRPVVIDDTADTDLLPSGWIDALSLKSCMVVPLVSQEKVIGVLSLDYCERPTRFADWQLDLAMAIAGQLALSLENTRLYAQVQDRLRETQALLAVSEALSQPGLPGDVMRRVARELDRATTADMVGAYFMNERKDALVALAGHHVPDDLLEALRHREMRLANFPFVADAMSMGRTVWSADALRDPRFDPAWLEGLPPHAMLFVPTLAHGESVGGLFLVWWDPPRPFPAAEIPLIEGVATQVGLSLENAELSRRTRIKLRETEALLSASRALASTLDLEAMLRHFMREAARTLGADTMAFWMLAEDGEWLEPFAAYHAPAERLAQLRGLRVSTVQHAFYADAVQRRRPALSALGQDDDRLPARVREPPHRSHLFVPIVAKERVIGALAAVWWETARALSDSELALLEALGSQVGVAVENARLFSENRRQVEELSVLYDFSRAVTGELDAAALVEAVHAHLVRVMDVRNMVVLLREDSADAISVALRIMDGVRNDDEPRRYPLHGVGLMSVVLETGRPLRTTDYTAECARRGVQPVSHGLAFRHWLCAPMRAGEQVIGVLAVRNAERAYTDAEERLLSNVADLAALALRSSRLYDERARAYGELAAAQDQLVRTEKLRALGEMASGVAHDFNNLLASILGRAQLLLQRIDEPRLRKWLEVIERSALDGAQTVRRLQEFTRIRRDQPLVTVDLDQVVRDALEITQSRWREEPQSRGMPVELRTALGDVPRIAGDPVELREALTNLILNAVDAMPRGGRLELRTRVVDGQVELAVSDTGIGMPESVRQRIFDPFFTTKGAQGTGLGLSITYGILMRHRARVAVESEPGHGTTFTLLFEPGPVADATERMVPVAPPASGPLRCLVVDDEESVGTVLGEVLETGGHSAAIFTSGADAVDRFRAEPFDVVFTDLAMPGLSGWQVARAVKAVAPTVPVFLVTGFGVELSAEERRAHGVDLVLSKPLNIQSILDAVAYAAARRAQAG